MLKVKGRKVSVVAGLLLSLLAGGCNSVGSGNQLVSIHLGPEGYLTSTDNALLTHTAMQAMQCRVSPLYLYGDFSDSPTDIGDFTTRADWTSSDTSVLRVSNGDEPNLITTGTFLGKGYLIPVAPGTATITAHYLSLTASIVVTVKEPTDLTVTPDNARIAVKTHPAIQLSGKLNGVALDLSSQMTIAFSPANDAVATATNTTAPYITALSAGGPLTLNLTLPYCGNKTVSTTVRVADIQSISLSHEAGFSGPLVTGTTEFLSAKADFGDGPEQDVSAYSTYSLDTTDTTASTRLGLTSFFVQSLVAGDAVNVHAQCCAFDLNGDGDTVDTGEPASVTSNDIAIMPVARTLTSFTIAPTDASLQQLGSLQYTAVGTFDSGAYQQPMTRSVSWSTSDATAAVFPAFNVLGSTSGLLTSLKPGVSFADSYAAQTLTITAANVLTASTATSPLTTTVTINPPSTAP